MSAFFKRISRSLAVKTYIVANDGHRSIESIVDAVYSARDGEVR